MTAAGLAAAAVATADGPHQREAAPIVPRTSALDVLVETRSARGRVFCAIWRDAEGYPVRHERAAHEASSSTFEAGPVVDTRRVRIRFPGVDEGPIAVACFHDENANGTLDTNLLGIPSEGTGASRGARGWMGPPQFEDARFSVSDEGPFGITIRIDY